MIYNYEYVLRTIAERIEEDPELEYKAAGALMRDDKKVMEITKDVSAFANSNGGVLIYGIAEDTSDRRFPGSIDPVDNKVISKEWLEQVINSKIRPRIQDLKIHVVNLPNEERGVVYIVEIPRSDTAHQAEDKKYYRRHNFMVEPLYDHEIRDIMNRQKAPNIKVSFVITQKANVMMAPNGRHMISQQTPVLYQLIIYIENVGKLYAQYVNLSITFPERCQGHMFDGEWYDGDSVIQLDNKVRDLLEPEERSSMLFVGDLNKPKQYGPARHEPLLPGMRMMLKSIPINECAFQPGNLLRWTVYADNAEPKSGEIEFSEI